MKAQSRSSSTLKKRSEPSRAANAGAKWTKSTTLSELKNLADPKARATLAYFGVNVPKAYGISAPVLHALARRIGKNHKLASNFGSRAFMKPGSSLHCLANRTKSPLRK
jgi:3-methyladenine DNA glycosylase AlkD